MEHLQGTTPLSASVLGRALGLVRPVPLTSRAMARSLRVAFYPTQIESAKLNLFLEQLTAIFLELGVQLLSYDQALAEGQNGRIGAGITLIAPGEGQAGNLAIDHVASLADNIVVGVVDGTMPGAFENRFEKRIQALVGALTWHMVHTIIYVDDISWTICNMNGAIDTFSLERMEECVLHSLVPKLAAPVIPPQKSDFQIREQSFQTDAPEFRNSIADLLAGMRHWGEHGLMAAPTKIAELAFRNLKYRRIANAYLSWRTGMSYGFLARQLPLEVEPALRLDEAPPSLRSQDWTANEFAEIDGELFISVRLPERLLPDTPLLVKVPEVSAICTRSGCNKTAIVPATDLVQLTLRRGQIIVNTPAGLPAHSDCQPSFDTLTILAHAAGNSIVASLLKKLRPSAPLPTMLRTTGLALAHWHGYLLSGSLPAGYFTHGVGNPPVSCSTAQAALFALSGKLVALQQSLAEGTDYLGDLHIEPSHGSNVTGGSLIELAHLVHQAAH